jgi:hypothetical protein
LAIVPFAEVVTAEMAEAVAREFLEKAEQDTKTDVFVCFFRFSRPFRCFSKTFFFLFFKNQKKIKTTDFRSKTRKKRKKKKKKKKDDSRTSATCSYSFRARWAKPVFSWINFSVFWI